MQAIWGGRLIMQGTLRYLDLSYQGCVMRLSNLSASAARIGGEGGVHIYSQIAPLLPFHLTQQHL